MSDAPTETAKPPEKPVRRSRPYLRLLWLIPSLAMLGVGLHFCTNVKEGGEVTALKLTTKSGMVGQASEAVANVRSNPNIYLKIFTVDGEIKTSQFKNTPVGNGLTWNLDKPRQLHQFQRVEVWDDEWGDDEQLDRITLAGWAADGQRFHVDLLGQPNVAPKWALPAAAVGGAFTLLVLLRFVWDQVI
jgi:hypothetical protein